MNKRHDTRGYGMGWVCRVMILRQLCSKGESVQLLLFRSFVSIFQAERREGVRARILEGRGGRGSLFLPVMLGNVGEGVLVSGEMK